MSTGSGGEITPAMNLLENLRKFRFNKKLLASDDKSLTSSDISDSSSTSEQKLNPSSPLTLEPQKPASACSPKANGVKTEQSPPSSPESPIPQSTKKKVRVLVSDEEDSPSPIGKKKARERKLLLNEDERSSEENALKTLHGFFPNADILLVQDALCQANWEVEKAKSDLDEIFSVGNTSSANNNKKRSLGDCNGMSKSAKRKKRHEVDAFEEEEDTEEEDSEQGYKRGMLFNSDAESDEEIEDEVTGDKLKVLEFLSKADVNELQQVPHCSKKRAEWILECRPFTGWKDMLEKFEDKGGLGGEIVNHAQSLLQTRDDVAGLIKRCVKLADKIETVVAVGLSNVQSQPSILSPLLKLSDYQLVGLNWLLIMHSNQVNGILADEMGLGKTVQVIAFLAHLKENKLNISGKPHLVVVPSSTLENWRNEFERWCPSMKIVTYYGSQEDRKFQRLHWSKNGFEDSEVVLTTYSMVSSGEERKVFRIVPLHYAVFDEAHMLKNMSTQRYENLVKINAPHRILLTGTPLQNNLLELMSLLAFVMPKMFQSKKDSLKTLFSKGVKQTRGESENVLPEFERTQISQAKHIMKPFVLRRLKSDVLKDLPQKIEQVVFCGMIKDQEANYKELVQRFSKQAGKMLQSEEGAEPSESGMAMYMKLRRLANHPLLLRYHFKDEILKDMAKRLQCDPLYKDTVFDYIFDDLFIMSDFELHQMCLEFKSCFNLRLRPELMCRSGKLAEMDNILKKLKENGHRVLVFSQFVIVLDILEEYFKISGHKYRRLDGSTPVTIRQEMIDDYNQDPSIFIFMLSTRAGGLGINLTSADTVIIHDVDPNPHNDKQAEDRCHRIGQTKPVTVLRLVSKGTIEENIYNLALEKLQLEKEISSNEENEHSEKKSVAGLLKQALGL